MDNGKNIEIEKWVSGVFGINEGNIEKQREIVEKESQLSMPP